MPQFEEILDARRLSEGIEVIMEQNRRMDRLDGWFLAREIMMNRLLENGGARSGAARQADLLERVAQALPLSIRPGEIFAGTENDAFARSYALINPEFHIENFEGYCDEDAVYKDIEPNEEFTAERIERVRKFWAEQPFAKAISEVYAKTGDETREVAYFVERVTGHTIPDFRPALKGGVEALQREIALKKMEKPEQADYYAAMSKSLHAATILADRYAEIAEKQAAAETDLARRAELELIADTCRKVPRKGAENLYEALQSYILLWQAMNLEQLPNPFAFSVGNIDRVMQPFFDMAPIDRELAAQMTRHFLAFFCVGDRNWAISQNIMVGGMDAEGRDLTCEMTHVALRAFEMSNYSQPNLSVKLHPGSPDELYESVARFMFEFGHSTPSFFNDPVIFEALKTKGVALEDAPIYGSAGCQEPLIMGKDSSNTTNSWLNLAKILELSLSGGVSAITGKRIGPSPAELGLTAAAPKSIEEAKKAFSAYLDYFLSRMAEAANGCTEVLAMLPVPFHSAFMGGIESGADMRDITGRGAPYIGSGCLIHGLANVADSFSALKTLYEEGESFGFSIETLLAGLKSDFEGHEELRDFLSTRAPKYGNGEAAADMEVVELATTVSRKVNALKNPWGANFAADWSTPSSNLLYGYWVGATPDGRKARKPLAYGVDPAPEASRKGLLPRVGSQAKLDYSLMPGGSASAMSVNPDGQAGKSLQERAAHLRNVMNCVFDYNNGSAGRDGMMYVYFNVFSPEKLRHVMEHPGEYPNPVLVRIHGQYGDARHLSPDILGDDVIPRLDPLSTAF